MKQRCTKQKHVHVSCEHLRLTCLYLEARRSWTSWALSFKHAEPRGDLLLQRPRTSTFLQAAANTESSTDVHDLQTRLIAGTRTYNGGGMPPPREKCGSSGQRSDEKSLRWLSAGLLQLSEETQWEDSRGQAAFSRVERLPVTVWFYSFVFYPLPVKLPFPFVWSWFYFLLLSVSFSVDVLVRFTCVWAQAAACSCFLFLSEYYSVSVLWKRTALKSIQRNASGESGVSVDNSCFGPFSHSNGSIKTRSVAASCSVMEVKLPTVLSPPAGLNTTACLFNPAGGGHRTFSSSLTPRTPSWSFDWLFF